MSGFDIDPALVKRAHETAKKRRARQKGKRGSLSISSTTYARLKAHSIRTGRPIAQMIEDWVDEEIGER